MSAQSVNIMLVDLFRSEQDLALVRWAVLLADASLQEPTPTSLGILSRNMRTDMSILHLYFSISFDLQYSAEVR